MSPVGLVFIRSGPAATEVNLWQLAGALAFVDGKWDLKRARSTDIYVTILGSCRTPYLLSPDLYSCLMVTSFRPHFWIPRCPRSSISWPRKLTALSMADIIQRAAAG